MNSNQNNGCGCNCNTKPKNIDIQMDVCDRNINMLPMLQTYTTKVLQPNINCCGKNILTQEMLSCENYKYIIKWNFVLGEDITVPKNCLIEFDGGSISNDNGENFSLTGQDTYLLFDLPLEEVLTVPLLGTFIYEIKKDKLDNTDGMAKIYLKSDKSFAEQVDVHHGGKSNAIYVIQYDFTLDDDITLPENCILEFDGGSISGPYTLTGANTGINAEIVNIFGTDVVFAGSWIMPIIYPEYWGAVGNGTTIDDMPFTKMADFINNNTNDNTTIKFGHKHYKFNTGIQIKKDITIDGNNTTFEYTVETAQENYFGLVISKDNPVTLLDAGTVSATKDTNIITTTKSVPLTEGDYFIIEDTTAYSWSATKTTYHAGDLLRVKSVSENTITVTDNITQTYSNSNVVLRKLNTIKAVVSDINFICHNDETTKTSNGVSIVCGVDSVLQNLRGEGSFHIHFALDFCYGASIKSCFVDSDTPFVGLNYGAAIQSSKNISVSDCFLKTARHGLTTGGSEICIPNRYITITGCIFDTYNNVASIDTHDNGEYIFLDNCIIKGGFSVNSLSTVIQNCEIFCRKGIGYGVLTQGKCRDIKIKGNVFRYENDDYTSSLASLVMCKTPVENNTDTITISDNIFYAGGKNGIQYPGCINIKEGNKFHDFVIENNKFYAPDDTGYAPAIMLRGMSANKIILKGNYSDLDYFVNTNSLNNDTDIVFQDNIIKAKFAININNLKKVDVVGNYIKGANDAPVKVSNSSDANKQNKYTFVCGNIFHNCNQLRAGSSVLNAMVYVEQINKAVVVENIYVNDGIVELERNYKYRFEQVDNIRFQNNKFFVNYPISAGTYTGTPTTFIEGDTIDNVGNTRPSNVEVGYQWFDTTSGIEKPIWYKGNNVWVDAAGAEV